MKRSSLAFFVVFVHCSLLLAAEPNDGIASKYANDIGIKNDPNVIFASGFEQGFNQWQVDPSVSSIVNGSTFAHSGNACATTVATKNVDWGGDIGYALSTGVDQLYMRFYCKFAPDSFAPHHFVKIQALKPGYWPNAGTRPQGDQGYWTGIEPNYNNKWGLYTYWHEMHSWSLTPDTTPNPYYGNNFVPDGQSTVPRDKWICVEVMMKANTVGQSNGEMAYWIDGQLVGDYRPGNPVGTWARDSFVTSGPYNSNPQPFEGFDFRTDPTLQINHILLQWYVDPTRLAGQPDRNIVYFDDVVLATKYIGPMSSAPEPATLSLLGLGGLLALRRYRKN